jgi:hypothetical protein
VPVEPEERDEFGRIWIIRAGQDPDASPASDWERDRGDRHDRHLFWLGVCAARSAGERADARAVDSAAPQLGTIVIVDSTSATGARIGQLAAPQAVVPVQLAGANFQTGHRSAEQRRDTELGMDRVCFTGAHAQGRAERSEILRLFLAVEVNAQN